MHCYTEVERRACSVLGQSVTKVELTLTGSKRSLALVAAELAKVS